MLDMFRNDWLQTQHHHERGSCASVKVIFAWHLQPAECFPTFVISMCIFLGARCYAHFTDNKQMISKAKHTQSTQPVGRGANSWIHALNPAHSALCDLCDMVLILHSHGLSFNPEHSVHAWKMKEVLGIQSQVYWKLFRDVMYVVAKNVGALEA